MDFCPEDREKVYQYMIDRFGLQKVSFIAQFGTLQDRGTIDVLAKGLDYTDQSAVKDIKNRYEELFKEYSKIVSSNINLEELDEEFADVKSIDFEHVDTYVHIISNNIAKNKITQLSKDFDKLKSDNKEIFYYFEGLKGTIISKGHHPAGMICSDVNLSQYLGVTYREGDINKPVSFNAMKGVDFLQYSKFDILGLNTLGILKDFYNYIGVKFKRSHEIDFKDKYVWDKIEDTNVGLFQFESKYAYELISQFVPKSVNDMSLVNASLRPASESFRDDLMLKKIHPTPSSEIDKLLKDNYGYLVYQEDTINFLTDICGMSGSEADNLRRAIGKKDKEALKEALPFVLEGYCNTSSQPREIAEKEAKEFLEILSNSVMYQFSYNHSTAYSMIGYTCGLARTYHSLEFTTSYLNRAKTEDDLQRGDELCKLYNIKVNSIKFGYSHADYRFDKEANSIYKGMESIKYMNEQVCDELYKLSQNNTYQNFPTLLLDLHEKTSLNARQLRILTTLNFFSEFGENKKLLNFTKYFDLLNGKKQFSKAKLHDNKLDIDLVEYENLFIENSRQTEKTYMDLDTNTILLEIWDSLEDESIMLKEQIENEIEFLGYIETILPTISEDLYFVYEFKIYNKKNPTPYVKLYNLQSGEYIKTKVDGSKKFIENEFELYSILQIDRFETKPRFKIVDGKYEKTGETQEVISKWSVIQ